MKSLNYLLMTVLAVGLVLFACKKEEAATCSDGKQNQNETGIDCGGPCAACKEGVHGKWKSYPVAPILASFADSIIATFNTNNTYTVEQYKGGNKTILTGTFVQTKPTAGTIWTIKLDQSSPTTLTAEGMFEVTNNTTMKYEVVQTNPSIGAGVPKASEGFGSSTFNGTKLGTANIQNYVRLQ